MPRPQAMSHEAPASPRRKRDRRPYRKCCPERKHRVRVHKEGETDRKSHHAETAQRRARRVEGGGLPAAPRAFKAGFALAAYFMFFNQRRARAEDGGQRKKQAAD